MPDPKPTPDKPKPKKRGWFRRVLRWCLILLLLVAIFHRPLFHWGARLALHAVAARMHMKADLRTSGTIFTNLTVEGIRAEPVGDFPNPVRKIDIARVRLEYSLPRFFKHGLGELLSRYEIKDAELDFLALPSKDKAERQEKMSIAQLLNTVLGQPALYSDRVKIENLNLTVRAERNVTEIRNFNLFLDPEQVGHLRLDRLQIPGVPVWENLNAETSYEGRNLFIRHLELAPELSLEEINFDASQRAQHKGSMQLKANAFGGTATLKLQGSQLDAKGKNLAKSYDTSLEVTADAINVDSALAYFRVPKTPFQIGSLGKFALKFAGEPEKPQTWVGDIGVRVEGTTFGKTRIDGAEVAATFRNGKANVTAVNVNSGKNTVGLTAQITLPESVNDFPRSAVDAVLKLDAPDLPVLTAMLPEPVTGTITGGGPVALRDGKVSAELVLTATKLATGRISVEGGKVQVKATKRIDTPGLGPFDELESEVVADLSAVQVNTFTVDMLKVDGGNRNALVTLRSLEVRRAENSVTAQGTYQIPRDFKDAARAPVDARFSIKVPKIADFGIAVAEQTLAGHLNGEGTLKLVNGALTGGVAIEGGDFRLGEFVAPSLTIKTVVADNVATVEQFTLKLQGTDQVTVSAKAGVQAPFPYEGGAVIDIRNLAALQPLLAVFKVKQPVSGALHVEWNGKGEDLQNGQPLENSGTLSLALEKGRFDKIELNEIKIAGLYGPGFATTTELHLASGPTDFTGTLEMKEGRLRLSNINLAQAKLTVLTGYVLLPIDLENKQQPIPPDGRIAANLNATKLDVEKLLSSFGITSPVSGNFTANIVAGGTLAAPLGHLKLNATGLKSKAVAALEPAALDLDLHYSNKELTLASTLKQPQIQPLTVKGRLPLDLDATVKNKKLDPTLPLDVTVQLPASSLAIVPKLVPQVRRIEGTVALDVHVAGSVEKPVLSGSTAIELKGARMVDENIPALGMLHAKLLFANDTLTFSTFNGELGGGTFKLGGNIKLPKLTEPVFALQLQSKEVLLKRDDSITIRADSDIKVDGPLNAGAVSGTLWLTQSRFFKEIDILPIALPGNKARPVPKAVQNKEISVSFPKPPLRDWKFDLAIKTRPKDSFLVRGNLANGAAGIDLKLGGTGLAPYLEGSVHIEEFTASLPFSTLTVSRGFVYFNKDAPFQPSIDIQADSQLRDYVIHAYIYGKTTDPQIQLSSEPPLPYADIVSLLATGTTVSELGSNADVLASRAAMLAIQQLYRKIFKRNAAPVQNKGGAGDFMDRFKVELGAIDNRTGGQEVNAQFRFTDQMYLLGDIGVDGNFTGSFKYLIRFR